jgi:hypothetical protein
MTTAEQTEAIQKLMDLVDERALEFTDKAVHEAMSRLKVAELHPVVTRMARAIVPIAYRQGAIEALQAVFEGLTPEQQ